MTTNSKKRHSINWIKVQTVFICSSVHISPSLQCSLHQTSSCSREQRASCASSITCKSHTFASKLWGLAGIQDNLISPRQTGEKRQARELQHPHVTGLRAPPHFLVPLVSEAFLRRALRLHSKGLGTMSRHWHGSCSTGASLASTERLLGQTAEQRNQYYSHAPPLAVLVYALSLLQQASPSERRVSLSSGATTLGHCEEHHGGGR